MNRFMWSVCVCACLFLTSCNTVYLQYREDFFAGKQALRHGEYTQARALFDKAISEQRRAMAFAYAATTAYKMNDLAAAEQYIFDAEKAEGGTYAYMRIFGYKALILLKEGKTAEGLDTLKAYIDYYRLVYPLMTIDDVEAMWKSRVIDQARLESLIDEQVVNFEQEIEQAATTGTGYYATRSPQGIAVPFLLPD